jgi:MFS family permease
MRRERDAVQRRTVAVLALSQALGGLGLTIGIAVAAVLAERVSGSETLAGLVQTFQVLGAAVASYLLARVMDLRGRRVGLVLGYLTGAAGALLCVVGGAVGSFPVLLLGALLLGANGAANLQSRYAAADLALPQHRGRALSIVVWATTIGAVAGPNLSGPAGELAERLDLPPLTGPFVVSLVVVLGAMLVVGVLLRPDPLLMARELAGVQPGHRTGTSWSRVRHVLRERPPVLAGVVALSSAHAVMVAVMVMTPLHMDHGGATLEVIGLVISIHVLGMFFFAPAVGVATDRFGRIPLLALGGGVLLASLYLSGTAPMGASVRIGLGLFLLGLGWSLCTVAGSTLLTDSTPIEARTDVQGAADLVMNVSAAAAGALAGVVVGAFGFTALNAFAALLVGGVAAAVILAGATRDAGGRAEI